MRPSPAASGIKLGLAPKTYTLEQDKSRPPQETVRWVQEGFARLRQEVLRRVKRIDTGRLGIPVYIALCGEEIGRAHV